MTPSAAFVSLADAGLCTVLARVDAVLDGSASAEDVEAIHELRVGVRHLRAILWAFQPVLSDGTATRWKTVLRDTAEACGETRDWDVFLAETLEPALAREPGHPVLMALRASARARREAAHADMMTKLSRDMRARLGTLEQDVRHMARHMARHAALSRSAGNADAAGRLDAFAQRRVRKARRRVRALARAARDGKTEHVHRLRIANKRLRYAIEALADVLPSKLRKRLHKKLVRRQTALGAVVDDAVARRLLCACLVSD